MLTTQTTNARRFPVPSWLLLAAGFLTIVAAPAVSQAQSGLVGAWGFNEGSGSTVSDVSGNNNTGTISGATWSALGRFGGALNFDGVNDVVLVPSSASLSLTTGMTLSAWVIPTAAQSGWRAIVQREVDSYFLHASSDGALQPAAGGIFGGTNTFSMAQNPIPVNTWTHLALTYNGTTIRLFVNGVEVASRAQTGQIENNGTPIRIGGNSPYIEFFQGRIDDVRVYNRALLASEIQSDMAVGVGGAPPPDVTVPTIAITTPTTNPTHAVSATPLALGGTAGDNVGVTQVSWVNDRGGSGTATGTTSWSVASIALQAGDNIVTVTARDAAGNQATDVITVTYAPPPDVTVPTVAITTPTSNPTHATSTTPITLGGTAGDNVGVTQVSWTNDRGGSGTATGTTSWSAAGIALLAGDNVITVTARDAANNQATDVITVTYTPPDVTLPTVTITTPTTNPTHAVSATPLALGGTAGDNVGVTQVSWVNDRGGSGTATGTTSWSVASIALLAGDNIITVTARDAANNQATDVITVTYTPPPDVTAPTVTITTPTTNPTHAVTTTPITLGGTAGDNVGVTLVSWFNDRGGSGTASGTTSWSAAGIALQTGDNLLTVTARDAAGNQATDVITVTYTPPPGPVGLVGAWGFNEGSGGTVADASGNSNTGTISGATWSTLGRFGNALTFDGVNDVVVVPNAPSLNPTTAITVSAWVFLTGAQSGWRAIAQKEVDAYFLHASNSGGPRRPAGGGIFGGTNNFVQGPTAIATNTWTHLAMTYDGSAIRLFVNGTQVASTPQTGAIQTTSTPFRIGGNSPYVEFFQGRIDDVRVYGRALSGAEIQTDMAVGVGGGAPPDVTPPTVAITTPTSNPTHSVTATPLALGGTAGDNVGVTQVTWVNDRGGSGTATGTTSWSTAGIVLQSGQNILTVTARDAAGNQATDVITVTYTPPDVTVPTIAITTPTSNPTHAVTATPITVGGTASDNVGVTQVTWVNNRGGAGTATGTTSWSVTGIALLTGDNVITVTARDAAGNQATDVITVTFAPTDVTVPTIAITTPTTNPTHATTTSPITVGGTAGDDVGVTQVSWVNDRGGSGTATGTTTWSVPGIVLQTGANVLTVTARDAAGNQATDAITVTYTPPDVTVPTISITTPTSNPTHATSATPITVGGTAGDDVGVTQVTWVNDRGGSGTATGTTSWSAAGIALQNGDNVITVTARDAANNQATDVITVTYTPPATPPGLVAAWGFNEGSGGTVTDASGNNNTGTISGAAWSTLGRFGNALSFDGTNDVIVVNNSPSVSLTTGSTLSAWVFPTGAQSGWRAIVQKEVDAYHLHASNSGGALRPASGGTYGGTGNYVQAPSAIPVNTWTHLASTYDGATLRLFVNGVQVASTPQTGAIQTTSTPLRIGGNSPYIEFFLGRIDEVRVYNRALSATEIQSDMTVGVGGGPPPDVTVPTVAITTPTSNPTHAVTTTPITVGGTAGDNVGVTQVSWVNNRGGSGTATGTTSWSAAGITLLSGDNIITVTARDAAGNQATDVITVTYTPSDVIVPTISITTPTANPTYATTSSPLTVGGTAGDDIGVTQVTWTNDRGGSGTATGTTSWSAAGIVLLSGDNIITVTARDAATNQATDVITVTYTPPASPPGLVAAWAFDEGSGTTVTDVSGNNNTGTITGPAWSTQGRNGNALSFDGTNDIVLVPNSPSLNLTTASTFSAWVFPTGAQSGWRAILQKEVDAYYLHAGNSGGDLRPATGGTFGSTGAYIQAPNAIAVNTWTHLAATYDGATLRLFVNGTQVASAPRTGTWQTTTNPLRIGGNSPYIEFFLGRIDDVRIYNRALSVTEIQNDMAVGVSPAPPRLVITQPAEGAALEGTTVAVAYSASGNLAEANHVHFQLDANPEVMDLSFDGSYQFTNVLVGSHLLKAYLARADHSKILGTDATPVSFSTSTPDSIAPTVAITAPAGGATVVGTVTVSASASDNTGVAGVQFYVDGVAIGGEDTNAPYAVSWNTLTVGNGSRSLTARARDGGGNQTTSAPVVVTVNNNSASDPAVVGLWSSVINWPLVSIHMALMPDGKVLAWDDHTNNTGAGVFDPVTQTMTNTPFTDANLFCAGLGLLPDGRVFIAGGHIDVHVGITNATLFNGLTQSWSSVQPMQYARWYPTVTRLPDGRMLTLAGEEDCNECNALRPEIFSPATGTWTQLNQAQLDLPYYPHAFVLSDGRVLVSSANRREMPTYTLNTATQSWATVDPSVLHGGSAVMYRQDKIMKSGRGRDPDLPGAPSVNTTYVLDMTAPSPAWRQTASMNYARSEHNLTLLPDGTVIVIGGGVNSDVFDPNAPVLTPELWNPTTETWSLLAPHSQPRIYHSTALLMPDGRVLSAGGGRYGPSYLDAQFYSPPYLFKGPRPVIISAPSTVAYGDPFIVQVDEPQNIAAVTLVGLGAVTHAFDQNQRFVSLNFSGVPQGVRPFAPANANLAPPGHYMLFLIDTNGVPSVASIVRVQ